RRNNFCFSSITNDRYPTIPYLDEEDIETRYLNQYEKLSQISKSKSHKSKIILLARAWSINIPSFDEALERSVMSLDVDQHLIILSDYPTVNGNPIKINRSITKTNTTYNWKEKRSTPSREIFMLIENYQNVHYLNLSTSPFFDDIPYHQDTVM